MPSKPIRDARRLSLKRGDWVWLHMRKDQFPVQGRSKLLPKGDGPFRVLQRINDNAYKFEFPGKYGVTASFNVYNLSPFDVGDDLRANPLQEGENNVNKVAQPRIHEGELTLERLKGNIHTIHYACQLDQLLDLDPSNLKKN